MIDDFTDASVLLGLNYSIINLCQDTEGDVFEPIYLGKNKFMKSVLNHLCNLYPCFEQGNLAKKFQVSIYFLRLIVARKDRGGRCLVCDRHFHSKVNRHLQEFHLLGASCINQYDSIFSEKNYFYMPSENRKLEDFPDNVNKIKKPRERKINDKRFMLNSGMPFSRNLPQRKPSALAEFYNPNCIICSECGKILTKSTRSEHMRGHKQNEFVDCSICERRMKKRYLLNHLKTCGVHLQKN